MFDIRDMDESNLEAAHALSTAVHWPHRREDWQFALSLGHGVTAHSNDCTVGTAMWWTYADMNTRIGMVIVDPKLQRSGLGSALMRRCLDQVGDCNLALVATAAGQPLYEKLGFKVHGSIYQHQGNAHPRPLVASRELDQLRPARASDMEELIALDADAFGIRREGALRALMRTAEIVVATHDATLCGFAVCRRFGRGHLIGPVAARDAAGAQALILHWMTAHAGRFLRIDLDGASELSDWLERGGLKRVDHVHTMLRGAVVSPTQRTRYFAIVNQALG